MNKSQFDFFMYSRAALNQSEAGNHSSSLSLKESQQDKAANIKHN